MLRVLSLSLSFFFASSVVNWLLTAMDKVKFIFKCNLLALLINFTLDLLLIPIYGIAAAAVAVIVSMLFPFCIKIIVLAKSLKGVNILGTFIKPFFAALFMAVIVFSFGEVHFLIKIVIGIFVYGAALLTLSVFDQNEQTLLKNLFSLKKLIKVG